MPKLRASLVPSPLTRALIDGSVRPDGVELDFSEQPRDATMPAIIEQNSRRMLSLDLDLAEMSFGTLTRARDRGMPIVGLPIFPGRRFLQHAIAVIRDSGIQTLADVRGKRASLGQFWQTAYIWHRLALHSQCGIRQEEIRWVCTAPERWDELPKPSAPTELDSSGRDPVALLREGKVDVAFLSNGTALLDLEPADSVRPLFEEPAASQREYFRETGIFPIIHLVVLREGAAQDPAAIAALCEGFAEAKARGLAEMIRNPETTPILGGDPLAVPSLFGPDPWPYGIEPNRGVLETYLEDVFEHQGLTERRLNVSDLFPENLPAHLT